MESVAGLDVGVKRGAWCVVNRGEIGHHAPELGPFRPRTIERLQTSYRSLQPSAQPVRQSSS